MGFTYGQLYIGSETHSLAVLYSGMVSPKSINYKVVSSDPVLTAKRDLRSILEKIYCQNGFISLKVCCHDLLRFFIGN